MRQVELEERRRRRRNQAARKQVEKALRAGKLSKEPCAICGAKKVEAHHPDHRRPLDVIWLCREHHSDPESRRRAETRHGRQALHR